MGGKKEWERGNEKMKIKKQSQKSKIEFMNNALLVNNEILVISDLHIGYEDVLADKGIFPRSQLKNMVDKLNGIFFDLNMRGIRLKKIIICGDLKHEFGEISEAEWREAIKLLDFLIKTCKDIVLIKGNHDNILGPIAQKQGVEFVDYYKTGGVCFIHGNKMPKNGFGDNNVIVMGHLHPAISISDGYKKEKYKCFLKGKWKKKEVYILPSFSEVGLGYDLIRGGGDGKKEFLIIEDKFLEKFNVIIYNNKDKKEYDFGKLKKLM